MPPRIIGLYALACMEREGPVYGYFISRRISERTGGAWRPGAGAVYPALRVLVERGLARKLRRGRRSEYRITPAGRSLLRRLRRDASSPGRTAPDLSVLWADVVGASDVGPFLVHRLRRTVQGIEGHLARLPASATTRALRRQVVRELAQAQRRVARPRTSRASRTEGTP
ncbi:MAG: PadR family transcriptional regulator [Thermoplasmata archaeon]|nr:PadR family transcriptional regulator [Thermoplasmata archaeon]